MTKHKKLTEEQLEKFKELYLAGYSASLIFEKLGQPYANYQWHNANRRMASLRNSLGLPKRGVGCKPRYNQNDKTKEK